MSPESVCCQCRLVIENGLICSRLLALIILWKWTFLCWTLSLPSVFSFSVIGSNLMFVEVDSLGWLLLLYRVQNIHFVTIVFSWHTLQSASDNGLSSGLHLRWTSRIWVHDDPDSYAPSDILLNN
ncbi:hypothetical protein VNO77_30048 [Canavalia gladiata]|uniref:Uncharacterized protein n=1 Tax=Canavalia gladiata TaxID=3824 RepID=A0AAN9Q315_CANGL